jgi:hypothetical protein
MLDDSGDAGEGGGDPTRASSNVTGSPGEVESTDEMEAEG